MAKVSDKQRVKIKKLEKKVKEEESLWEKIKKMPDEDKFFLKKLKEWTKRHKVTKKPKVIKGLKKKADKLFWGLEPPEKE